MLRITTHDTRDSLTFQVEGMLVGAGVNELNYCWQNTCAGRDNVAIRVDLKGVTFIDAAAKQLLAAMHAQGAEFVCAGCLTRAIVAEITRCPCGESGQKAN